jgi:hypothetical protein
MAGGGGGECEYYVCYHNPLHARTPARYPHYAHARTHADTTLAVRPELSYTVTCAYLTMPVLAAENVEVAQNPFRILRLPPPQLRRAYRKKCTRTQDNPHQPTS